MQPGDILVVQLNSGPGMARYIETESNRVRLAIGRNREARLPESRVMLETGVNATGYEAVEALSQDAETVAEELDLEEVWEIVWEDGQPLTLIDIGELYWGAEPSIQQTVGLLLHLSRDDLRFVRDGSHYLPRDRDTVEETIERRQRRAQRTADAEALSGAIQSSQLPDQLTPYQSELLDQIRGFVLHGDDFTRANAVKRFLEDAGIKGRDLQQAAFQNLVSLDLMQPDEHLALERAGISADFSDEVRAEAETIDEAALLEDPARVDLTELFTITIDDYDTKDRDDALSIEALEDSTNGAVYRAWIHITDAGALIPQGSALDTDADNRMSSLYLPEQKINMLPPAVSTDKGSLNPGERRAAMSLIVELTEAGEVVESKVVQSVIQSDQAVAYEEADRAISDESDALHEPMTMLYNLAMALRSQRESRGALNLDRDEMLVSVDESGNIEVGVIPRTAASRMLVQEYMVLCNSLLAKYCSENELPVPFRSQVVPDVSDIKAQVPEGSLRWYMMVRRLSPATVSTKAGAHGGLGVEAYTQATSPLRRYPDLVVQRQISHHVHTGETLYDEEAVTSIAHRADMQVRQMSRIENQRRQHFFLKWLDQHRREAERRGEEYLQEAVVLENPDNRAGVLELVNWPFRTRAALPNSVKAGETVPLQLHGVDLWRRTAQFTLAQRETPESDA